MQKLDIPAPNIKLHINGEYTQQTRFGGFATLITSALVLILNGNLAEEFYSRENPFMKIESFIGKKFLNSKEMHNTENFKLFFEISSDTNFSSFEISNIFYLQL